MQPKSTNPWVGPRRVAAIVVTAVLATACGSTARQAPAATTAGAPTSAGQEGFGYTADEIHIGVFTASSESDAQMANAGLGGVTYGDSVGRWEALFADVNERGGVAGRQVIPEIATTDVASPNPAADRAATCGRFSQDTPVVAVLSAVVFYEDFNGCLQGAGVPTFSAVGAVDGQVLSAHPLTLVPGSPGLEQAARGLAHGLAAQGFFATGDALGSSPVIGLLVTDTAPLMRAAHDHLAPALAEEGLSIAEEVAITSASGGAYGDMTAQASSAVLRFRSAGVTHVLFLSVNAFEPTLFMSAAASQGYQPRYGLSSQQFPHSLKDLVDHSQLRGAGLVGWAPVQDVADYGDTAQAAALAECLAGLQARGQDPQGGSQVTLAATECEMRDIVELAGNRADALEGPGLLLGVDRIGADLASPVSHRVVWGEGRRTGPSTYRPGTFDDTCGCFVYNGPEQPLEG